MQAADRIAYFDGFGRKASEHAPQVPSANNSGMVNDARWGLSSSTAGFSCRAFGPGFLRHAPRPASQPAVISIASSAVRLVAGLTRFDGHLY